MSLPCCTRSPYTDAPRQHYDKMSNHIKTDVLSIIQRICRNTISLSFPGHCLPFFPPPLLLYILFYYHLFLFCHFIFFLPTVILPWLPSVSTSHSSMHFPPSDVPAQRSIMEAVLQLCYSSLVNKATGCIFGICKTKRSKESVSLPKD